MVELGRLEPVDIRTVWTREAVDFTPWLAQNLTALGNALGMELELNQMEAPVGAFALDILATEVNTNRSVVIENQLETTNHDHLGKLLTYASGYNADVVVWISREFREEHRQALDWLNQRTDTDTEFFGVVVETFRIDNSRPASRFDVVARPNQWRKTKVDAGSGSVISDRRRAYRAFFQDLIDILREQHRFTNARAGQPQSWYSFASGIRSITFGASYARDGRVRAEIYIDTESKDENKRIYDAMYAQRAKLEEAFGQALSWERLDAGRASRIAVYRPGSIDDGPEAHQAHQKWLIESLLKLKQSVLPYLEEITRSTIPPDVADPYLEGELEGSTNP